MPVNPETMLAARRARTLRELADGTIKQIDWSLWPKPAPDGPPASAVILSRNGVPILVDADLVEVLSSHAWHVDADGYARTHTRSDKGLAMHRLVLGLRSGDKRVSDHINMNRADNRRENLRACDRASNNRNITGRGKRKSLYKGVAPNRARWMAQVTFQRKVHHLGTFDTQEEAALAYNEAAARLHGEFARLNVIP